MDALLLAARCLLAIVFLIAAVGKLLDLSGSQKALEDFGVPEPVARVGGVALPAAELSVATALLIRPSAIWGAAGALCLLLVFVAGVAHAMSEGRAPDCHCFGQIHSEPAGRSTLIRNALLATPAILVVIGGSGPSLNRGLGSLNGTQVALVVTSVLAAALAAVAAQLWQDKRRLARDLDGFIRDEPPIGLPRGTKAPEFDLSSVRGAAGSLGELLERGRSVVLVFVSTSCGPCLQMLSPLGHWQQALKQSLTVAAIFSGEPGEIERLAEEHGLELALAQVIDEAFALYQLRATPSGVLITADGAIAGAAAEGIPAIEALIRSALIQEAPAELVTHSA